MRRRSCCGSATPGGARRSCDNPAMGRRDRFEDAAASVAGFYESWVIYLGIELGLFAAIRDAGRAGLAAAHASELVNVDGERAILDEDVDAVLLDDTHPEYLGGQFVTAVVSSLDYAGLTEFFRTGRTIDERPPRFHRAIEAVTVQDIAVFFQEGLAALPDLVTTLSRGG